MTHIHILPLFPDTTLPQKAHTDDACFDVFAQSMKETDKYIEYGLGFASEIPPGRCALIFPRSSVSNTDLILANHVGVVDAGYRGEWKMRFRIIKPRNATQDREPTLYNIGDRIGQYMCIPIAQITQIQVQAIEESPRGIGGFGSTGKK